MSSSYSDQPPEPKRYPDEAAHGEAPSALPKLGSLSQAARGKQLNQTRGILIVIGVLTVVLNGVLLVAAQSKIQSYPGDCDYFERINITAGSREESCAILRDLMREKALATMVGPTYRLWEVKFGHGENLDC